MALPYQFVEPILGQAPLNPRVLKLPERSKVAKYLELAELLLRRFPSESNGRGAKFLIDLCKLIEIGSPALIARIVPTLRLEARFARR